MNNIQLPKFILIKNNIINILSIRSIYYTHIDGYLYINYNNNEQTIIYNFTEDEFKQICKKLTRTYITTE